MGYERFSSLFQDFPGPFLLDPDPFCFCLDLDPYQSSPWIRISNEFFNILDPDPYHNYTDPPHYGTSQYQKMLIFFKIYPKCNCPHKLILDL